MRSSTGLPRIDDTREDEECNGSLGAFLGLVQIDGLYREVVGFQVVVDAKVVDVGFQVGLGRLHGLLHPAGEVAERNDASRAGTHLRLQKKQRQPVVGEIGADRIDAPGR